METRTRSHQSNCSFRSASSSVIPSTFSSHHPSKWSTFMLLKSLPPLSPYSSIFSTVKTTRNEIRQLSFPGNYAQEIRKLSTSKKMKAVSSVRDHTKLSDETQLDLKLEGGGDCESNDWRIWSVWCTELHQILGSKSRKLVKFEHEELVIKVMLSISNECPDFPDRLFLQECCILQLSNQGTYSADGNGKKKFRIKATAIHLLDIPDQDHPENRAGRLPTVDIFCEEVLADVLADILGKHDILAVFGGILALNKSSDSNLSALEYGHGNWVLNLRGVSDDPVHIIRVNRLGYEERPTFGNLLIESIQPWTMHLNYFLFKYVAVRKGKSCKINRYREMRLDRKGTTRSSLLDPFLFPISKEIHADNAFDVLIFYDWKMDPSWSIFKQRRTKDKKVTFNIPFVQFYYDPAEKLQDTSPIYLKQWTKTKVMRDAYKYSEKNSIGSGFSSLFQKRYLPLIILIALVLVLSTIFVVPLVFVFDKQCNTSQGRNKFLFFDAIMYSIFENKTEFK